MVPGVRDGRNLCIGDCRPFQKPEYVIIHDGGRPLVTRQIIEACLKEAKTAQAVCAVPVKDTIKVSQDGRVVDETPHQVLCGDSDSSGVFLSS